MNPFAAGSISLVLFTHNLPADEVVEEIRLQAGLGAESGFDGVLISERHCGAPGNIPNPVQMAGWMAEKMASGWVAPSPLLAPLRPAPLIVEEIAWLAARFPGRVGACLGTGGHLADFELYGLDMEARVAQYETTLGFVAAHLAGNGSAPLTADPAVARCAITPVPVLSATMSAQAARRAARTGTGTMSSSLETTEVSRSIGRAYREAGGSGTEVLLRHVWIGDPPRAALNKQVEEYRQGAPESRSRKWGTDELITSTDPAEVAERLLVALSDSEHNALTLRVHVPGLNPLDVRRQIELLGEGVLPTIRAGIRR